MDQVSTIERDSSGYMSQVSSPDVAWTLIPLAKACTETCKNFPQPNLLKILLPPLINMIFVSFPPFVPFSVTVNMFGDSQQEVVLKHRLTVSKRPAGADEADKQATDLNAVEDLGEDISHGTYPADVVVWYLGGSWIIMAMDEYTSEGSSTLKAYAAILLDSMRTLKFIYTGSPDASSTQQDVLAKQLDLRSSPQEAKNWQEYSGVGLEDGYTDSVADDNDVAS